MTEQHFHDCPWWHGEPCTCADRLRRELLRSSTYDPWVTPPTDEIDDDGTFFMGGNL